MALVAAGTLVFGGLTVSPSYAADHAEIYLVQGLPEKSVDVSVDGESVATDLETAAVAGPFDVKAGSRKVTFSNDGEVLLERSFSVKAKSSWDVVIHLPVSSSDEPEITVFENDLSKVPKDKAALTVAHTAAVPPADIRVNGEVLFANVANGESLSLVVPVATYTVDIVPTGESEPVFLGPLDLTVKGGSLNRVYAVGDPESKNMNVAVHVLGIGPTGSSKPSRVNTGTGGQAVGADPSFLDPSIAQYLTR